MSISITGIYTGKKIELPPGRIYTNTQKNVFVWKSYKRNNLRNRLAYMQLKQYFLSVQQQILQ